MTEKKKSFLGGAAILGVAGLLCKIIGAVYKIPLRNAIGSEAMGVYSQVYPIYTFLLVFSTSGIPTAISMLVAKERAKGNYKNAHKVFTSSLKLLTLIGLITTLIMCLGSGVIAKIMRIDAWQPIAAISFSLLFVSLLSAYRGYYQGMLNMIPTAVTQITEQIVKLAAGFIFAIAFSEKYGYVMAAAGALLGITVSELIAFAVIFIIYQKDKRKILTLAEASNEARRSNYTKKILQIAIPMTIGSSIKPLVDSIDSFMVKSMLQKYFDFTVEKIDLLYGFLKSDCSTLTAMPTVLTVAISMALVPALSAALSEKDGAKSVERISATGIKLSLIIGLPCMLGFLTMSSEMLSLLYKYSTSENLYTASSFLMVLSFSVLFLSVIQTAAGILQGLNKVIIPVINLFIGMAVKVIMNVILIPKHGMIGVPISTVTCYLIAGILDMYFVIKLSHTKFSFFDDFMRPLDATLLMGVAVFAGKFVTELLHLSNKLSTVLIIAFAALVYFIGLAIFKVLDEDDIALMPGGKKIKKLFARLKIEIRKTEEDEDI